MRRFFSLSLFGWTDSDFKRDIMLVYTRTMNAARVFTVKDDLIQSYRCESNLVPRAMTKEAINFQPESSK